MYETGDGHDEHDIIVIYEGTIFIVECKAKRIRKHFRDVTRAARRIESDFKDYIQEAFNQANKLKRRILSQEATVLFDRRGREVLRLERDKISGVECVCATRESEGILSTNLTMLLQKEASDDYPYCVSIFELREMLEYIEEFAISSDMFIQYIKERRGVQGKAISDDELDIWGYFLRHKSLAGLALAPEEIVPVPPNYSSMFDKAYRERQERSAAEGGRPEDGRGTAVPSPGALPP